MTENQISQEIKKIVLDFLATKIDLDTMSARLAALLNQLPQNGFSNSKLLDLITSGAELEYYLRKIDEPESAHIFVKTLQDLIKFAKET